MAVSSAERRNQEERIRQTREEYEERETQAIRRKNAELKRAEQRHQQELKRITEEFQAQVDAVKNRSSDSLSDKDRYYQQKINELRDVQRSQMRQKMEDSAGEREAMRNAFEGELQKKNDIFKGQMENKSAQQKDELDARDQRLSEIYQNAREDVKEGLDNNRRLLNTHHKKEMDTVLQERDNQVMDSKAREHQIRKSYESQLAAEKRQREFEVAGWNQKYKDTVQNNSELGQQQLEGRGTYMKAMQDRVIDDYQDKLARKMEQIDEGNEAFRDTVNDRLNSQVRSRESKIARLQAQLSTAMSENERRRALERLHMQEAYEAKLGDLERQKNSQKELFSDLAQKRINDNLDKNNQVLNQASREYKSELSLKSNQHAQDRKSMIELHQNQMDVLKEQTDKKVRRTEQDSLDNQKMLAGYYNENLEQIKDVYSQRLMEQRDENLNNVYNTNQSLSRRFKNRENALQHKIENMTTRFEETIEKMKEDHKRELKRIESVYAKQITDQEKARKLDREGIELKYENRIAELEDLHQQRTDSMQKKHEEELRNISNTRYSRKA